MKKSNWEDELTSWTRQNNLFRYKELNNSIIEPAISLFIKKLNEYEISATSKIEKEKSKNPFARNEQTFFNIRIPHIKKRKEDLKFLYRDIDPGCNITIFFQDDQLIFEINYNWIVGSFFNSERENIDFEEILKNEIGEEKFLELKEGVKNEHSDNFWPSPTLEGALENLEYRQLTNYQLKVNLDKINQDMICENLFLLYRENCRLYTEYPNLFK
jgi:hypothetical protein